MAISKIDVNKNTFGQNFEIYSILFHNLFFTLLQIGITLLLFIGIINLSRKDSEDLYPTEMNNMFYGDGTCDLGNLTAGETSFCDGGYTPTKNTDNKKSYFAYKLAGYAKSGGFATLDMFSILIMWFGYLAFSCEQFTQQMLKSMNTLARSLDKSNPVVKFFIIVILISLINNLNINTITPFITKLFNMFNIKKSKSPNILLEMFNIIVINVLCIVVLLFLFFMVPLTIYYVVALCKLLIENLSTQMNVMSVFALFMSTNTIILFVQFMISQFGSDAIRSQVGDKSGKAAANAIINAGLQDKEKFNAFITSYGLFFIVPIIVSFSQLFKLIKNLITNIKFDIDIVYKIIFMTIILISFYYPIKNDLDRVLKFPYSIIYAVIAGISVAAYVGQNKDSVAAEFEKKSNT
jgi:hypothetical protein